MTKLSFIVPVYNVAPYLRKCVDSLLAQDYDDYEIILVDDGSTDESGTICDEYAVSPLSAKGTSPFSEADHSIAPIRVIHQPNAGLSAARNAGIKCAEGKYLCFVDSDDYWEPNVLGGLMEQIEHDNLDVLRFKYQNVNERYETFNPNKLDPFKNDDYSNEVTDGVSFLNSRFGTACYAVMFVIRRDLIISNDQSPITNDKCEKDNIFFTPGIYFEDVDWTPRMLTRANRVASTNTIVYNYLVRRGSITKAMEQNKKQKAMNDKIRLISSLQKQAEDLRNRGRYNRWYEMMIASIVIGIISKVSTEFYEERGKYIQQLYQLNVLPIKAISYKAMLINLSPNMAIALMHFKNK